MNEQIKKVIDPIKTFWGKLTKKTKIVIFICLGAAVLLAVISSVLMNRTQYTVLYSGLKSDEAKEVTDELRTLNVDYQNDNGTVYVDKSKENTVRMQLSNEGYPKSVPNYDFFTKNVGVMTTDEERKIIQQYDLQNRLSAIIKTMDSVDTAYVTISLPENSTYAWDDNKQAATASVAIGLKTDKTLDAKQVSGIKQLIAKSVPNLKTADVTVVDTSTGEELDGASSSSSDSSTQITLSEFKLKIEKQYEDNLQNKIANLLAQAYGRGNLSVSVKSKMDLDKKIQDIVTYSPTQSGKGIVSHSEEVFTATRSASGTGGIAGTQSNTDTVTTYPGVTVNGDVITTKDSRTYDYLVSKVQEQIQSDAAALDDLTVAVVVNTNGMTDTKKQELTALIANAAAVDQSKVAVMVAAPINSASSQVEQTSLTDITKALAGNQIILIAAGALLLLLVLLVVLISAKKRRERREKLLENLQQMAPEQLSADEAAAAEGAPLEGEQPEDGQPEGEQPEDGEAESASQEEPMPEESIEELRNAAGSKEQKVMSDLQDFSDKNPEIAAQLIRSLLKGDDGKHG